MTHTAAFIAQQAFQAFNDDGTLATSTSIAGENANWTQNSDTTFRVRFALEETAGGAATDNFVLTYQLNGGGFVAVTAATPVQFATSGTVADGTAITAQRLSLASTFVNGEFDSNGTVGNVTLTSQHTEMEYCLTIDSAQVTNNDVIQFEVFNGGAGLDAYNQIPSVTASVAVVTNVTTTLDTLTLTPVAASIQALLSTEVSTTADSLIITNGTSSISQAQATDVTTTSDTLTITNGTSLVTIDKTIATTLDTLLLTEQNATVQANVNTNVSTNADALSITEVPADIQALANLSVNTTEDSLVVTPVNATVSRTSNTTVNTTADILTVTPSNASVQANVNIEIATSAGVLTISEVSASIQARVNTSVNTTPDTLTVTAVKATIQVPLFVNTTEASLVITESSSTVTVGVLKDKGKFDGQANLVLTGAFATTTFYYNGNDYFTID